MNSFQLERLPGFGMAPIPDLERYLRHDAKK
jgi:hypothetical protein